MLQAAGKLFPCLCFAVWLGVAATCTPSSTATTTTPPQDIPADTIITLERGACYGSCPIYSLTITADGKVAFEGKKYVKTMGRVEDRITPKQLRKLIAEFEKAKYFTLRDEYESYKDGCPSLWTDDSDVSTSLKINGKSKTIRHYLGCREKSRPGTDDGKAFPRELKRLEDRIDEIVGTKRWIK